jgi:tetratricopeptide (TPR) repeat protein
MKKYLSYILLFLLSVINTYSQTISEAAREKYIMGITLRDQAKTASDYDLPITKFKDAIILAPDWAEAYKELGLTLELAGQFDEAITNLNKYLSLNPPADNARKAQDEIYIIKGKKEKATIEKEANSPKAIEASLLKKVEGARFVKHNNLGGIGRYDEILEINDGMLNIRVKIYANNTKGTFYGKNKPGDYSFPSIPYTDGTFKHTSDQRRVFTIRSDGSALMEEFPDSPSLAPIAVAIEK